ncbi:NAD(P)H-binding protein [Actinokineospora auranticolor]|uniref:Uncharacterized protein YbjT (DUF2867 family) n=1 Tax=Actinokineospora auranticolor TaxID=155976 RepID=A0A2S6GCI1_9PSEU|nr:NAD(P)H-binding protein [Actinokineospora auranticolor]PPK62065.1 uncharacterized protein YbjT (DUF2867 family) [Actinokineospora auranticolor]
MAEAVIAVTGAGGGIGGRVARRLADAGATTRLVSRRPEALPDLAGATAVRGTDYTDAAGVGAAVAGAGVLFLVSARESANRVREHATAIDAAIEAGVGRIVYLSFLGAAADCTFTFGRDHWHTEQYLRATGVPFVALRDSTYASGLPAMTGTDGVLRGPAGDGRVSAVTPDDIAAVATAVLLDPSHDGQVLDVTGPEAITLAEAAATLTEFTGRPVTYHAETETEAYESRSVYGAPDHEVAGWVTSYLAIATGELSVVADTVPRLTGHPAQSFPDFLRANPDSYAHLLPGA